jgi:hypothetical protein
VGISGDRWRMLYRGSAAASIPQPSLIFFGPSVPQDERDTSAAGGADDVEAGQGGRAAFAADLDGFELVEVLDE